jgi:alanyl-tRNA synthetase
MVVKNDPTLMFTNAGMNQFKDIFLGNANPPVRRIANSQKCLRVSGKHNDLEEVGHDTYHHTMFEMLGNWSFGDYFKEDAIKWAWEFLTEVLKLDKERLYVTVFEGDTSENLDLDTEAILFWKQFLPEERILNGNKKDNFWEMGDTGPCGPCSEIHIDLRPQNERTALSGRELVNKGNPLVIEIWNLVFIQYNRKADGKLEALPNKHVDTGMGFERLCMAVQGKISNYDTDIFQSLIRKIAEYSRNAYGEDDQKDVAMRVIADHLRAISFSIADGQLPSNAKAGYVIRRILRRAVRYAYTFLEQQEPFIYRLVAQLVNDMGESYPELKSQQNLIERVIREEEASFLRTLDKGISLLDQLILKARTTGKTEIGGKDAFELYDTYGFPVDLTQLVAREHSLTVDIPGFNAEMEKQKSRSRDAAVKETDDWIPVHESGECEFTGYDELESEVRIARYRKITQKGKTYYQLVLDRTPFYAESGGQVGDSGVLSSGSERLPVQDVVKENNLILHVVEKLPADLKAVFTAEVNTGFRVNTANNHTATHLLHYALRKLLGTHVEQKGSLVHPEYLRFDFSHFQKVSTEEIRQIEELVNRKIMDNIPLLEMRSIPVKEAMDMGAVALFGEKYGDKVRVIRFDDSVELCGGTHARATGQIGFFKITRESAIAAGVRRIEAITGEKCMEYLLNQSELLSRLEEKLGPGKNPEEAVSEIKNQLASLSKRIEVYEKEKTGQLRKELRSRAEVINGITFLGARVNLEKAGDLKELAYQIKDDFGDLFLILGAEIDGKANLGIVISDKLVKDKNWNAGTLIRDFAKEIEGGGGGQPFFATAGGKKPSGIEKAIEQARNFVTKG